MAYIGIGYTGEDVEFLRQMVETNSMWLHGDRMPRFFGDRFLVLYDSNTAREFALRCMRKAPMSAINIFPMHKQLDTSLEVNI